MTPPAQLYHFTCRHSRREIGTSNCLLVPHPDSRLGATLLWLTTEAQPDRERTGLTMRTLSCDRMEFRYVVRETLALGRCRPWRGAPERTFAPAPFVAELEEYGDPEHWWIASQPVRAKFDRAWAPLAVP